MILIQFFFLGSLILLTTMPLVLLVLVFDKLRTRRSWRGVLVALSFVAGTCGGGALAWYLVPSEWSLPFRTTLEAAVNAEKYGHTIEHTAENILVFITFASVAGGVLGASIAAVSPKLRSILKHA
jgi:multisubunit Na+/H+ antiporter MnhB subunit